MQHAENEWEYDTADRVAHIVENFEDRADSLSTQLHLRWMIATLMHHVKAVHMTVPELVTLIAILAPVSRRPVINEWDYDVRGRVADALKCAHVDDLRTVKQLRWQLRQLLETVKITDLSVTELAAMLAVLAAANGRRLVTDTLEKALRPVLRLVDDVGGDTGSAALQLVELGAEPGDEVGCADLALN